MFNIDGETIVQILVLVLIFGGAILRFVYRNFVKPLADAEARRREAAGQGGGAPQDPATALRDFLAELRGETKPGQAPQGGMRDEEPARRRPEPRPEPAEAEIRWEPEAQAPPPRPVVLPVPGRPGGPQRRGQPQQAGAGRTPRRPAAQPAAEGRSRAKPDKTSPAEDRFKFQGGDLGPMTRPSSLENTISDRIAEKFAASAADAATDAARAPERAPQKIPGLDATLREAVIAQVVLGPPRYRTKRPVRFGPSGR